MKRLIYFWYGNSWRDHDWAGVIGISLLLFLFGTSFIAYPIVLIVKLIWR